MELFPKTCFCNSNYNNKYNNLSRILKMNLYGQPQHKMKKTILRCEFCYFIVGKVYSSP